MSRCSLLFESWVLHNHPCYFFSGQVLKGSLHPKEQPMRYLMETLLGGLPSMEVRNQKDYNPFLCKCSFLLTLYSLRWRAVFPKSANKDTLPVYNIAFDSHWSTYLRTDISSYEGGSRFHERNCFKMQKWT